MFIEVLIVVKFSNIFFLSFSFSMNFIESMLQLCRPQNSPWQLATAEDFAEANSVFIIITSAKILLRWLFPSKIYIQFTTFNTYFSLLLLFKWLLRGKRYRLHVLEKCLYVLCLFSAVHSSPFSSFTWQWGLEFMLKCSHKYDLVRKKKENAKVWTYALDNICIIFVILSSYNVTISSVSGKKKKSKLK